jgi:hypothetical protein
MKKLDSLSTDKIDFSTKASLEGKTIKVTVSGDAHMGVIDRFEEILKQLHEQAQQLPAEQVTIDIRQLLFMNSSCIKRLVTWITLVQELDEKRQYKIRIVSNPGVSWQRRSLESLQWLAPSLITIEVASR